MRTRVVLVWICATRLLSAQTPSTPTQPATVTVPGAASSTNPITTVVPGPPIAVAPAGETNVNLDVAFGIRAVMPSRITVPTGERLQISAPIVGNHLQWQKNGRPIDGATTSPLVISNVSAGDAGVYWAVYDGAVPGNTSQSLVLGVGPTDRITNVSNRGWVGGVDQPFITGFVVTTSSPSAAKKILLRVIGPSLAPFGVANFLRQPTVAVYDANGKPYENQYVYPAVIGGPTYASDLADALARTGAFPTLDGARDIVLLRPFAAGSYTVHAGSADGGTGAVLVEVYEVP